MSPARDRGLILALTGIALPLAATLAAYRPVMPLGPDALCLPTYSATGPSGSISSTGVLTMVHRTVSLDPAADR
jgi:hypothetical protein